MVHSWGCASITNPVIESLFFRLGGSVLSLKVVIVEFFQNTFEGNNCHDVKDFITQSGFNNYSYNVWCQLGLIFFLQGFCVEFSILSFLSTSSPFPVVLALLLILIHVLAAL